MLGRALNFSKELMEEIDNNYTDSSLLNEDEKAALRWAEVVTLKLYQAGPGRKSERPEAIKKLKQYFSCLLYTSPSPRDLSTSRMPSSA